MLIVKKTFTQNINVTTSNDLFSKYYARANEILNSMTLDEKVAQMFYARYPSSGVNEQIKSENPGGYILFAIDFENETKASILNKINTNQENSKINMFIGVDEEGGTVVRVSKYPAFRSSKFQSPQELWNQGGLNRILEDSTEKSLLLKSIGINTNFARVADLPTDSTSFIYGRSLGQNADITANYIGEVVKTMNKDNMISVLKHFPGYGDNVDTHTGVAVDNRTYESFTNSDFKPFISGIKQSVPMIMVNHNIVNSMDSKYPASLSKNVHDILRNKLGFTGLIITDDLAMQAVESYSKNGTAAQDAVLAGNDMIISSDFVKQKNEIIQAVKENKIPVDVIDNAVRRILSCKIAYGIIK